MTHGSFPLSYYLTVPFTQKVRLPAFSSLPTHTFVIPLAFTFCPFTLLSAYSHYLNTRPYLGTARIKTIYGHENPYESLDSTMHLTNSDPALALFIIILCNPILAKPAYRGAALSMFSAIYLL
jgi:hypothetical protein